MVLLQALFGMVARSAGKIVNTAFGWATVMLFGKVRKDRQIYLSGIAFGSVAWIVVLLGIAFPAFGAWLLTLARPPRWLNPNWVRLIMLIAAVIIPLIVGWLSTKIAPDSEKTRKTPAWKAVVMGYPYTLGMALTLVMMTVFAPVLKLQSMAHGWTTQHVPIIVTAEDYQGLVSHIRSALAGAGWQTEPRPASWMLRVPTRVLAFFAGGSVQQFVADNLTALRGKALAVELHPSDLIISGPEKTVAHARGVVAEQLAFSEAYMTWEKEANDMEDRFRAVHRDLASGAISSGEALGKLRVIERDLKALQIPYEEWEVLFREELLVQREALQRGAGLVSTAVPAPIAPAPVLERHERAPKPDARRAVGPRVPRFAALAAFAALTTAIGLMQGRR